MGDIMLFETCPNCDKEIGVLWDVEEDGYEVYCPTCGKKMMLCSMCPNSSKCDWDNDFNGVSHCMMMKGKVD